MSRILEQSASLRRLPRAFAGRDFPIGLLFRDEKPNMLVYADGSQAAAACLRCAEAPCVKFAASETAVSNFSHFPDDRSDAVCVSGALRIDQRIGAPTVDNDLCVFCGLCVIRCPVGALRLDQNEGVVIQDEAGPRFRDASPEENTLLPLRREGSLLLESDDLVGVLQTQLAYAEKKIGDEFPNFLARNLLITLGVGAVTRRKGNNHMRMDLMLGPPGVQYGIAEVEFGDEAILNVPRDILDDIAVMVSRYGWDKRQMVLAIIGDVLPNKRSEYWRIIQDIRKVLDVQISTVSILSLILLVWNRGNLALTPAGNPFYADCDTRSYRTEVIERVLGRKLNLFEPSPLVEPLK
jgi:Fe-S-cluster-containing hydrogenase component 2